MIIVEREHSDSEAFKVFKKELYHTSLVQLLEPLRPGMTTPQVLRCFDGHFRHVIFSIGPFIADYPERIYLSGARSKHAHLCPAFECELTFLTIQMLRFPRGPCC